MHGIKEQQPAGLLFPSGLACSHFQALPSLKGSAMAWRCRWWTELKGGRWKPKRCGASGWRSRRTRAATPAMCCAA